MTREEERDNASFVYYTNTYASIEFLDEVDQDLHQRDIQEAFEQGAEWADAHPDIDVRTMAAWQSGYNEGIAKYRWISVEDGLPKDGQHVATINKVGVQDVRHYSHGKWYSNFGNEYDDITHWMPMPSIEHLRETTKMIEKGGEE